MDCSLTSPSRPRAAAPSLAWAMCQPAKLESAGAEVPRAPRQMKSPMVAAPASSGPQLLPTDGLPHAASSPQPQQQSTTNNHSTMNHSITNHFNFGRSSSTPSGAPAEAAPAAEGALGDVAETAAVL